MDDSPSFSILLVLTVTVIGLAPGHVTMARCRTQDTRKCTNFNMVQFANFHAFIGEREFDEKCRAFKEVFECVYTHVQSCPLVHRFAFDIQKTVIDQVCFVRRIEYKESQRCFMQTNLEGRVNQCFALIKVKNCSSKDLIGVCVQNAVTSTDGCTSKDGNLMRSLADARFMPLGHKLKCHKTSAPVLATISPTTVATTIPTTDTTPTTTTRRKTSTKATPLKATHQAASAGTTKDLPFASKSTMAKMAALGNTSSVSGQQVTRQTSFIDSILNLSNSTTVEQDKVVDPQAVAAHSNNTASIISYRFDTSVRFASGIVAVFLTLLY